MLLKVANNFRKKRGKKPHKYQLTAGTLDFALIRYALEMNKDSGESDLFFV